MTLKLSKLLITNNFQIKNMVLLIQMKDYKVLIKIFLVLKICRLQKRIKLYMIFHNTINKKEI